jgi:hypothetical protein
MRRVPIVTWVVYERQTPGKPKMTVMCEQPEWDALVLTQPNYCTLVRAGMTNEGEAEQLARSGAVMVKEKVAGPKPPVVAGARTPAHTPQQIAMHAFWQQAKQTAAAE